MKLPTTYEKRHKVGQCPACHDYLWADVELEVVWSEPTIDRETSKANVNARAQWSSVTIEHSCTRIEDGTYATRMPDKETR